MLMALCASLSDRSLFLPSPSGKRKERLGMVVSPERRRCWSGIGTGSSPCKETLSIRSAPNGLIRMKIQQPLERLKPHSSQSFAEVSTWTRGVLTVQRSKKGPSFGPPWPFSAPPTLEGALFAIPGRWRTVHVHSQASTSWHMLFPLPRIPPILSLLTIATHSTSQQSLLWLP